MKNNVKRKISTVIILLFLGMSIAPSISIICAEEQNFENDNTTINFCQEFSDPIIDNNEESVSIHISEANSVMNNQGGPKLPIFTKTFEFPRGAQITDINYQFSDVKTISLTEKIESVPFFTAQSNVEVTVDKKESQITYESQDPYPLEWISFNKGSGINKNSEHVLFLTVRVSPVKHIPSEDIIQYINNVDLEIHYEKPIATLNEPDIYDLVIIAPLEYADELLPLVEHKESFGMKTNLTTLDYIYSSFPGRDEPEKIKYFIKYALEEWGIDYVLLIGSMDSCRFILWRYLQ